jgi:hypothetical protein
VNKNKQDTVLTTYMRRTARPETGTGGRRGQANTTNFRPRTGRRRNTAYVMKDQIEFISTDC